MTETILPIFNRRTIGPFVRLLHEIDPGCMIDIGFEDARTLLNVRFSRDVDPQDLEQSIGVMLCRSHVEEIEEMRRQLDELFGGDPSM